MKGKWSCALPGLLCSCLLPGLTFPADAPTALQESQPAAASSPTQSAKTAGFRLEDGTPVRLRLQRTLSSADAQVDDTVDFDVLEEVKVGDVVVIPKGSIALGTVTEAQAKRRMARGGKLNVNIDSVRLADGEKVPLRAVKDVKGGGHTGGMVGGMVATSIVFFPAAPFFLFMHGKDITIPKGTEITAYVAGDTNLNPAKFTGRQAYQAPSAVPTSGLEAQPIKTKATEDWEPFKDLKTTTTPPPTASSAKQLKLGMTFAEVESVLGQPETRVDLGPKVLYKYKDMTVEFHDGKVVDVR